MEKFNLSKPLIVLFTGALLWVALAMVESKVEERQQFRLQAEQSVAKSWTSSQTIIGPIIVIPYNKIVVERFWNKEIERYEPISKKMAKTLYILADESNYKISLKSDTRKRGIYPVPVYYANIDISGSFNTEAYQKLKSQQDIQLTGKAYLSVSVSDSRGIFSLPKISLDGKKFNALSGSQFFPSKEGFSAEIKSLLSNNQNFSFQTTFELNGMTAMHFLATAKNQNVSLQSDWPHPKFIGAFLPITNKISDDGYQAEWKTSQYSVDFETTLKQCVDVYCAEIFSDGFGVKQIEPVDVYRQSQRAVTYGILFIIVTFIAFALVEVLKGIKIHPVQYGLAGANLSIFFLLLLSFSEHISFGLSYILASVSVTAILYYYLLHSFNNSTIATFVSSGIALLYAILYLIVRSEDHALLAGSLLLFGLLTAVIISTRNINWYRS